MNDMQRWMEIVENNTTNDNTPNTNTNDKQNLNESKDSCDCKKYDCGICFPPKQSIKRDTIKENTVVRINNSRGKIVDVTTNSKFAIVEMDDGRVHTYHTSDLSVDEDEEGLESPLSRGEENVDSRFDFFEFGDEEEEDEFDKELDIDPDDLRMNGEDDYVDMGDLGFAGGDEDLPPDVTMHHAADAETVPAHDAPEDVSELIGQIIDLEDTLGMETHDVEALSAMSDDKLRAMHSRLQDKMETEESVQLSADACPTCNGGNLIPENGSLCPSCLGTGALHENEMSKWVNVIDLAMKDDNEE